MTAAELKDVLGWAIRSIIARVIFYGAIFMLIALFFNFSSYGRDNSDLGEWGATRSGLTPRTDHLTGCQYLETAKGGITPRLDGEGRQIGCKTAQDGEFFR